jgi:hypothetical protein
MVTNAARESVYGKKAKERVKAVVHSNRHIVGQECSARAKKYVYGPKQLRRQKAVMDTNRDIAAEVLLSKSRPTKGPEAQQNHPTTTIAMLIWVTALVLFTSWSFAFVWF